MNIHPDRGRVLAELHARPFIPAQTPSRLLHFAFLVSADDAEADTARIESMSDAEGVAGERTGRGRHRVLRGGRLRWERHGEFVSYTIEVPMDAAPAWPDDLTQPGLLLVSVDLRILPGRDLPSTIVRAAVVGGRALLASDFDPNALGFVRIDLANLDMTDEMAGATVQRVLEIETYRCLALLGLRLAEKAGVVMRGIETELPALMRRMDAAVSLSDNRLLLNLITSMTLRLKTSSAETHFRFGATRAYAELVHLRLEALAEIDEDEGSGLTAFFSRRFHPAVRTCATASEREADLARKLTRAAQLLRTRVDIALESQNGELLQAMGDCIRLQLRLQQTVEGLSASAISYYVASIFHLVLTGLERVLTMPSPELLTAAVTPVIVVAVALALRRIRISHL